MAQYMTSTKHKRQAARNQQQSVNNESGFGGFIFGLIMIGIIILIIWGMTKLSKPSEEDNETKLPEESFTNFGNFRNTGHRL